MENEELLKAVYQAVLANADDVRVMQDMLNACKAVKEEDTKLATKYLKMLSEFFEKRIALAVWDNMELAQKMTGLHKQTLLEAAKEDFDSFILYTEWNREPEKQFYKPRRKVLKKVVDQMQRLADGELDLLGISMPPGTGKSTLAIFYLTWMGGKYPTEPMLTGSHSNAFVRGVYDECLRMLDPHGDYLWHDVFPDIRITNTNAKDTRIDLGNRKRFETLQFTSIGTGNAGLYRAGRLLYCDDLVSGIEVALSRERLDKLWEIYTTDLRQRKIGNHCAELAIATRWAPWDILGRLEQRYGNDPRAEFLVLPAMDENDESNFDYDYGVGFTTEFYREQREIMDDVSWKALYMNQPIERDGLLCTREELRRYFELPESPPDAIFACCDTKDRGDDFCALLIVYQYGRDYYLEDCVVDNGNPENVEAQMVAKLLEHKVQMAQFESNQAGGRVAQKVQQEVLAKGGITKITTQYTMANKETKIIVNSPFWKLRFLFKDDTAIKHNKPYRRMLDMICSYTMAGKNKHDDVVDCLAQFALYLQNMAVAKVSVISRPY